MMFYLSIFFMLQIAQLNSLILMLTNNQKPPSSRDRMKIMTVCTVEVHNRDVVNRLILQKVENAQAFTRLSQLRHRWDDKESECFANTCDAQFRYSYEYLGNAPRLVITPLTDRWVKFSVRCLLVSVICAYSFIH